MKKVITVIPLLFILSISLLLQPKAVKLQHARSTVKAAYSMRPSITPTLIPSATPTHTVKPTSSPTATPPVVVSNNGPFIDKINEIRHSRSIPPIEIKSELCDFAQLRAGEITQDFTHAGFDNRRDTGTLPYSGSHVVENIAMGIDPIAMWMASPTHESNLMSDITRGCVGNNGDYYVFEGVRP